MFSTMPARIIALLFVTALGTGCVLDREGRFGECPEGKLVCTLSKKEYAFTPDRNAYSFVGRCDILRADGGSEFTDPTAHFKVRGEYDRNTLRFLEAAVFEGLADSTLSVKGTSAVDPWLSPGIPVGITAVAGDPAGLAHALCLSGIPPEYYKIPFTRNVIVHMMSAAERAAMAQQAANPKQPTPPPAPPCPPLWVKGPPTVSMPSEGLVYAPDVEGVTVYLTSKCGATNVNYQGSFYQAFFEHYDEGWKPFRGYKMKMSYAAGGGSLGSETLPLDDTGLWRVRARQVVTQQHANAQVVSEMSDWVQFRIGPPVFTIEEVGKFPLTLQRSDGREFRRLERTWVPEAARTMTTVEPAEVRRLRPTGRGDSSLRREDSGGTLRARPVID